MSYDTALPIELVELKHEIESYARAFGLDFFPAHFEMLDYKMMNQVAAYDGFPVRYPHWRFGMEYERLSKSYAYGLHRIYEMVINNIPCYAYLLASNNYVDQKLVMAHVYGHCDFFKNNMWFAHTNRKMLDEMANHAARVRRHIARVGLERVEDFLDAALSIENLIDIHSVVLSQRPAPNIENSVSSQVGRLPANEYMDAYINPPEFLAEQERRLQEERDQQRHFPSEPVRDVLLFLLEHARLENWQRDILDIVREEAYYFVPQRQTKIMNEGWASFVHTRIMTYQALTPNEVIDYADHHAGTVAVQPGQLNPYKIGMELYRYIEDRWNRGAFGPEYEACRDLEARRNWDRGLGLGRQKVFEVRRVYNDIGFIDEFMTEDFVRENRLFAFDYNPEQDQYEISSRDFKTIKQRMLAQLTNFGQPAIEIVDANYKNRGELLLAHRFEGRPLDIPFAEATLKSLQTIWGRHIHLGTQNEEGESVIYSTEEQAGAEQDS